MNNTTSRPLAGRIIMALVLLLIASLALATVARAEDDGGENGANSSRESEDHVYAPQESGNTTGAPEKSGEHEDSEQENSGGQTNSSEKEDNGEHEDSQWRFDDNFNERPPKRPPIIPPEDINYTDYNYSDYNATYNDTYNYMDYNDTYLNESYSDTATNVTENVSPNLYALPTIIKHESNTPTATPPPKHERSWFAMLLSWLGLA